MLNDFLGESQNFSIEEIAEALRINPEVLREFDRAYQAVALNDNGNLGGFRPAMGSSANNLTERIVDELVALTPVFSYHRNKPSAFLPASEILPEPIRAEEIYDLPKEERPQCTGLLTTKNTNGSSYPMVLYMLRKSMDDSLSRKAKKEFYWRFRQGLDTLDLDGVLYEMLGRNENTMGFWLPKIAGPVSLRNFLKIPDTTIIRVPITLLQLSRIDYKSLTPATIGILDRFCQRVFQLDESKSYFVKTGTFSSKFDFRNALVSGAKEINSLGEHLLSLSHQAAGLAAHPIRYSRSIIDMSTTNEWVVREYIPAPKDCPTIYQGLPLRTEYRLFVDFDTDMVIGCSPYWKSEMMKERFRNSSDLTSIHNKHDYAIFLACENELMARYCDNIERIRVEVSLVLPLVFGLCGQWSMDIMQEGDDFWLIDMARAENSALYDCVPPACRYARDEDWVSFVNGSRSVLCKR